MLDNLAIGLVAALGWNQLLAMLLATCAGLFVGVVPGLGPITAMALLIPFTFTMNPLSALLALASISIAANCSGSFTSILLNVPGETSAAATCYDGHPMARQGRATIAIGLSIGASFFAAVVSSASSPSPSRSSTSRSPSGRRSTSRLPRSASPSWRRCRRSRPAKAC